MSANGKEGSGKEKVGKKTDRDLDLANNGRTVWLVKVPKYISDRWERASANTEVGRLRIKKTPGAKHEVNFTLADSICAQVTGLTEMDKHAMIRNSSTAQQVPNQVKFKVSSVSAQTLGVFSHTSIDQETSPGQPDKLSLEGNVVHRAECLPIEGSLYNQIKREAIIKAGQPTRQMQRLDKHVTTNFRPISNHAANIEHNNKKKMEGKKMRDDKDKVQEILFALFEKHQFYNIKDLQQETRQPMAYLREILNEVCVYSVKPPNRNMWELKPEYRHYKSEESEVVKKKGDSDSDSD